MIVQCSRCTCPLDANPSMGTVTCTYCGTTQPVSSLQVLRNETPPGWQPPPFWAPPPEIQAQLSGGGMGGSPFGPPPGGGPFAPPPGSAPFGAPSGGAPFGMPGGNPYGMQPGGMPIRPSGNGAGCGIVGGIVALLVVGAGVGAVMFLKPRLGSVDATAAPTLGTFVVDANQPANVYSRGGSTAALIDGHRLNASCRGYFSRAPDMVIRATDLRMYSITTTATDDLTMAVGMPGGSYLCDDDSGQGMNPLIHMALPAGTYPVWVGAFRSGVHAPFTLMAEATTPGASVQADPGHQALEPAAPFDPNAAPALGETALTDPPQTVPVVGGVAGGPVDGQRFGPACRGHMSIGPSVNVRVASPLHMQLFTTASDDLTMVVQAPSGEVSCDDDGHGSLQPVVNVDAQPGVYHVWVGEYSASARGAFALVVTTTPAGGEAPVRHHRRK